MATVVFVPIIYPYANLVATARNRNTMFSHRCTQSTDAVVPILGSGGNNQRYFVFACFLRV